MIPVLMNRWTLQLPEHRVKQWANPWEKERLDAMHDLIRPGDILFDIGAEEGDMGTLFASWGADIVAVEAAPRVWSNIRACFEANGLSDRLRGWYVGFCGDESTKRHKHRWEQSYAGNGRWPKCADGPIITDHGFFVLPERPDASATTIDDLALQHGPPTVITIDTEGSELTVLRGARRVLTENRPAVYVSVHLDLQWVAERFPGDTGDKLDEWMRSFGYEGRHLATDHERHMEYRHPEGR